MSARRLILAAASWALLASPALAQGEGRRRHAAVAAEAPLQALVFANDASRQGPTSARFEGARQVYAYEPGAIYELYTNPNFVSTILLEPGETLNNIAAGDTSRWLVTQAEAETDNDGRTIVMVKPQAGNLRTNIVLITDRRTYLVEAIAGAGGVYSAQIAWRYPQATAAASATSGTSPMSDFNFNYRVRTTRGRAPAWAPARVFDDGRRTWVEFAPGVAASEMAPLFVITPDGAELVNYRVQGQRYMVDRIFDVAELRLGARAPVIVRIERNPRDGRARLSRHGPHP
jgi:type IV secretion system protein VirB9